MGGAGRFGFSGLASWPSVSPGLARWLVLLDPFRVGAWVIPRVRGCVFLPRACALGCPARPFQGRLHTVNGPQPGMPAKYMTIGMDRGRLLTVRPLRLIRRLLGTITRRIATVSRVGNSQRTAGRIRAIALPGDRNRHRDRCHGAADINKEVSNSAPFSMAIATTIAIPIPMPTVIPWQCANIAAFTKRRNGRAFQGHTAIGRGFRLE